MNIRKAKKIAKKEANRKLSLLASMIGRSTVIRTGMAFKVRQDYHRWVKSLRALPRNNNGRVKIAPFNAIDIHVITLAELMEAVNQPENQSA